MTKKIFTVVYAGDEAGKTDSVYYAADNSKEVLHALPADRDVVAISFGPVIEVL